MTKKRRRRPPRRPAWKRALRTPPSVPTLGRYLRETEPPEAVAHALRMALPLGEMPRPSHWVRAGTQVVPRATGLSVGETLDAFEAVVRWTYERDPFAQLDRAVTLAQVELERRRSGMAGRVLTWPEPPEGAPFTTAEVLDVVADWEALSYAHGLSHPDEVALFVAVAKPLATFLAQVDGVPIRPDRLDTVRFAEALDELLSDLEGLPSEEEGLAFVLDAAAELYTRLIELGHFDAAALGRVAEELRALSRLYRSDPGAAVA